MISRNVLCVAASLLVLTGCVAPIARTTQVGQGVMFDGGGGLAYYRGLALESDSTSWWKNRTVDTRGNVGVHGHFRVGYGQGNKYGGDLSLAFGYGPPVGGTGWGGWLQATLGGKVRPWKTNNLLFLELGVPKLGVGWVGGLPMNGPERVSLMVETGTAMPDTLALTAELLNEILPPNMVIAALSYNIYQRRFRLSPNVGVYTAFEWRNPVGVTLKNVLAGVTIGSR